MGSRRFEFRHVVSSMEDKLGDFFQRIVDHGDDAVFHPHAFDRETAGAIARSAGLDRYVVVTLDDEIVGYGMLRGWDEGYEIPSLGMIIGPSLRGKGVGASLLSYLHSLALVCGAPSVRLTVYATNESAIRLYERHGYILTPDSEGRLIGKWEPGPA